MNKYFLFIIGFSISIQCVSQPATGYYNNAANKSCANLKTALYNIINTGVNAKTYTELWSQYLISDLKPREVGSGSTQVIWDMYSDNPTGLDPYNFTPGSGSGGQQDQGSGGSSEGDKYNREHSVPQSWFSGNTATPGPTTDYHHIFPTDKYVNNRRGNQPYGEVATASQTFLNGSKMGSSSVAGISGTVFEPINEYKGDFARAFLYFVTMYENEMVNYSGNSENAQAFAFNSFPSIKTPYLQLMIKWHNQDAVSAKEIARNNAGFLFQGNRNPFVDSPQYVLQIWNGSCAGLSVLPATISLFTGKLQQQVFNLQWDVVAEENLKGYEVEKSINGSQFYTIAFVPANGSKSYGFAAPILENLGQRVYFRLKKIDKNGSFTFSEILNIYIPQNAALQLYPNPTNSQIQVILPYNNSVSKLIEATITDITGRIVWKQMKEQRGSKLTIETQQLKNGFYTLQVKEAGRVYTEKIQVQH